MYFQFEKDTSKMGEQLDKIEFILNEDGFTGFSLKSNQIFQFDLKTNTFDEILFRNSELKYGNKVEDIEKVGADFLLAWTGDFGLKMLGMRDKGKSASCHTVGYLCPYCLKVFQSHKALFKEHLNMHVGPVVCDSCQVSCQQVKYLHKFTHSCQVEQIDKFQSLAHKKSCLFSCQYCTKTFKYKCKFLDHFKIH